MDGRRKRETPGHNRYARPAALDRYGDSPRRETSEGLPGGIPRWPSLTTADHRGPRGE